MEEPGVEHGDVREIGQDTARDLDAEDGGRVVQRRQRRQCPKCRDQLVVDDGGQEEVWSAVDHPVPDRDEAQLVELVSLGGQRVEGRPQRFVVVGDLSFADALDDSIHQ